MTESDPASWTQGDHHKDLLTQKMKRNTCFFQYFAIFPHFKIFASPVSGLMLSSGTGAHGHSLSLSKWGFSVSYENLTHTNLAPI